MFILIKYELTDFVLRTVVLGNGRVEIVGIDRNENELFKFRIDKELLAQHDKLLDTRPVVPESPTSKSQVPA